MRSEDRLKRYTTLASVVDMLVEEHLPLLDPIKWKDTNDTHFLGIYQDCVNAKGVYAACFTQAAETYHHWQVFAGENEGVCIEFDKKRLLESLQEKGSYLWGDVKYRSLKQMARRKRINVYELPFLKRIGFSDEKEFRLIYRSSKPQRPVHLIAIKRAWVMRIILNPWLNDALFESIKLALKSIPGCQDMVVLKTSLINNSEWKEVSEKVEELEFVRGPVSRLIS